MSISVIRENPPPNEKLIEALKQLLFEAEEGHLQSYVGIGIYNNCDIHKTYVTGCPAKLPLVIGELFMMIQYILDLDKENDKNDIA